MKFNVETLMAPRKRNIVSFSLDCFSDEFQTYLAIESHPGQPSPLWGRLRPASMSCQVTHNISSSVWSLIKFDYGILLPVLHSLTALRPLQLNMESPRLHFGPHLIYQFAWGFFHRQKMWRELILELCSVLLMYLSEVAAMLHPFIPQRFTFTERKCLIPIT